MVITIQFTVGYLNATINRTTRNAKPGTKHDSFSQPGETRRLTDTCPGFAHLQGAGHDPGWFWIQTEQVFGSKPGPPESTLDLWLMFHTTLTCFNHSLMIGSYATSTAALLLQREHLVYPVPIRSRFRTLPWVDVLLSQQVPYPQPEKW